MIEIVVPKWGLTMDEMTVIQWLKQVGMPVTAQEPLVEVETDKSSGEIESPATGLLVEILVEAGTVVEPGDVIGRIQTEEG